MGRGIGLRLLQRAASTPAVFSSALRKVKKPDTIRTAGAVEDAQAEDTGCERSGVGMRRWQSECVASVPSGGSAGPEDSLAAVTEPLGLSPRLLALFGIWASS